MTTAIDERIAQIIPGFPPPLPAPIPSTGDGDLDAAIAVVTTPRGEIALALAKAKATKHADPASALLDVLEAASTGFTPYRWSQPPALPDDLQKRAYDAINAAYQASGIRAAAFPALVTLLEAWMDPASSDRLLQLVERPCPPYMARALAGSLLGHRWNPRVQYRAFDEKVAVPRGHLEALAGHARHGDPLLSPAMEAAWRLDPVAALATFRALVAGASPEQRSELYGDAGIRMARLVDFDDAPGWLEPFAPMLREAAAVSVHFSNALLGLKKAASILAILPAIDGEALFSDMLDQLRSIDDPAAAAPLAAIATTLPEQPGKKAARSRETVNALAKRLARKRKAIEAPSFAETAGVGTDGGPILLVDADAAKAWKGTPEGYGTPSAPADNDYDRACAAVDGGGSACLEIGSARGLVLPNQRCGFAPLADGAALLMIEGSALLAALVLAERGAFRKLPKPIELGPSGAVLLDAAYSVATAPEGGLAHLPLRGSYRIEEARRELPAGEVFLVRLTPVAPGAPAKTSTTRKRPRS